MKEADPIDEAYIDECRSTLADYHADALSVLAEHGIRGTCYDDVWPEIGERLNRELEAKDKTDGALFALGEFLHKVEDIQSGLEKGHIADALLDCLVLVRLSHRMRGQMILREDNLQRLNASRSERPGARSELRARIIATMKGRKANGVSFKRFMSAWDHEPLDGLRLTKTADAPAIEAEKYDVSDENAIDESRGEYTYKTLRDRLWAAA